MEFVKQQPDIYSLLEKVYIQEQRLLKLEKILNTLCPPSYDEEEPYITEQ
jgi:hypothetical protein